MVAEEGSSWDMVSDNDLWEGGNIELDQEGYILVRQEDIVEGVACFMAAYLLSLEQTKVCDFLLFVLWESQSFAGLNSLQNDGPAALKREISFLLG